MLKLLKRIYRLILPKDPGQIEMDYLKKHGLRIGNNFHSFSPYAFDANWPWLISVGDDVTISSNVKILAHDASPLRVGMPTKIGCVDIGDNVFIGTGTIILCNTRIGNNVIIGAGSVVSKSIPDNSVAAGNPAKVICSFDEYKTKHIKQMSDCVVFDSRRWYEWKDADPKEWEEMRNRLSGKHGYV